MVIAGLVVAFAGWHDGLFGTTSIKSINEGDIPTNTSVVIKGKLVFRLGNLHTVASEDEENAVLFEWTGQSPPIDSIVIVRGKVASAISLKDVTSVETPWLFK